MLLEIIVKYVKMVQFLGCSIWNVNCYDRFRSVAKNIIRKLRGFWTHPLLLSLVAKSGLHGGLHVHSMVWLGKYVQGDPSKSWTMEEKREFFILITDISKELNTRYI